MIPASVLRLSILCTLVASVFSTDQSATSDDDDDQALIAYIILGALGLGFLFFLYNTWRCHRNRQLEEEDEENLNKIEFSEQKDIP